MNRLTLRQQAFVDAYLLDPSSIAGCARKAGYTEVSSRNASKSLMKSQAVLAAIEEGQNTRKVRLGITEDRVLQELATIAFSNIQDIIQQDANGNTTIDLKNLKREHAASISEVETSTYEGARGTLKKSKVKKVDKLAALALIAKHLGMLQEKVEIQGKLTLEELVMGVTQVDSKSS